MLWLRAQRAELGLQFLIEIYKKNKLRTIDVIQFLYESKVNGFDVDYYKIQKRSEKTALIMKVNRNILDKLEAMGYLNKNKLGRENEFILTESGKYIVSISGLIQIKPEEIIKNQSSLITIL